MFSLADKRFMDTALALAVAQLGRTAPNPSVGCVLVRDGRIVGRGATADGGRPHAERSALAEAGEQARGSHAYVTLEPCAFHGQTPPCADALVAAGIAAVDIACLDAHPKVDGRGVEILRAAGITVRTGLRTDQARPVYEGFFHRLATGLPRVYVDARPARYDAELTAPLTADLEQALRTLGEAGANRVCVAPGSPLVPPLAAAGLLAAEALTGNTVR
jgi:diaminohydroxyphosphoribosylaminopyrimidine deaminase/5-amino-6-(5-phosphoribosylamino)uracil reductase